MEITGIEGLSIKYLNNCDINNFNDEEIRKKAHSLYHRFIGLR